MSNKIGFLNPDVSNAKSADDKMLEKTMKRLKAQKNDALKNEISQAQQQCVKKKDKIPSKKDSQDVENKINQQFLEALKNKYVNEEK